ncbi:MAG: hypothetical protein GY763_12400 [Gammaproteobacteria bacterium]|nr:hypothetical protein [Gammaproteobacteria bacterium]
MKQITKILFLAPLGAVILASCQTSGKVVLDDAKPFTRGELYAYLSENTQERSDGNVFYSQEGTLETLVDGEQTAGTWSTYNGGKLCRHIETLEDSCEVYYHDGDGVSTDTAGTIASAPNMVSGNTVLVKAMFNRDQMIELVSGKTVVWPPNGGAYYGPDGKLDTLWDGVRELGKWEVTAEGTVCWKVPSWGTTPCEAYYMGAEGLRVIYSGKDEESSEYQDGNTLDSL